MMQRIITPDNSVTFHNPHFDEAYHSKSGAKEEAVKKFAEPCQIAGFAKKGNIRILDICFGLGYNSAAAIDAALAVNSHCKIEVVGLEIDEEILYEILNMPDSFACYPLIKETIKNNYNYTKDNLHITLILGDAVQTIKQIKGEFDAVLLDPFSPKKCPQLWTKEFFDDIYSRMKPNSRLATYSCARVVRDNLKNAGFQIFDGPKLWRRGPSTIAVKK
jgi:tRNA U34 5-methylaminomethyl-2-thiouridine-forming methyltransferase MnmC